MNVVSNSTKPFGPHTTFPAWPGWARSARGPLAGPVFAAAVILPPDFPGEGIRDSKKLSEKKTGGIRKQK